MPPFIEEPAKQIPVAEEVDVCVLGGSCTGVFAAVRAARLGARVAVVEKLNAFGGVATNGLVAIWHSMLDTEYKQTIMAGLTQEVIDRLGKRNAVKVHESSPDVGVILNTEELKIELDELVREHQIVPFLHTHACAPILADGRIDAVCIENKDGRSAIRAKVFIDATGDGDLARAVGLPFGLADHLQPPTLCAKVHAFGAKDFDFKALYREHREAYGLRADSGWSCVVPGVPDLCMFAETHVFDTNAADARQLTAAEMEGRRQIRACLDMLRDHGPRGGEVALTDIASHLGIRETRRFQCAYTLTEEDVLHGKRFDDAIANGSYRVDVHHPDGGGFLFKYLDGSTLDIRMGQHTRGRWREETAENPTFYQVPYRTMVHPSAPNLILAGRMIATDRGAFGAVRVMVNLNQVGEAAGVAAALMLETDGATADVDPARLRATLAEGGSVML